MATERRATDSPDRTTSACTPTGKVRRGAPGLPSTSMEEPAASICASPVHPGGTSSLQASASAAARSSAGSEGADCRASPGGFAPDRSSARTASTPPETRANRTWSTCCAAPSVDRHASASHRSAARGTGSRASGASAAIERSDAASRPAATGSRSPATPTPMRTALASGGRVSGAFTGGAGFCSGGSGGRGSSTGGSGTSGGGAGFFFSAPSASNASSASAAAARNRVMCGKPPCQDRSAHARSQAPLPHFSLHMRNRVLLQGSDLPRREPQEARKQGDGHGGETGAESPPQPDDSVSGEEPQRYRDRE